MNKKSLSYPIVFMVGIAAIFTLLLAFLNESTLAMVQENENLDLRRKILYVFDLYDKNTTDDEVTRVFDERISEEKNSADESIYILKEGSETVAYAVPFNGPGLWGSITGYIGINRELNKITGIEFITQNETPGLGGRISEAPYKEQFRGVEISDSTSEYIISKPAPGGNIDTIAGATQTSTFVQNMINDGLKRFIEGGGLDG
ncbi:MAG: FMN-binding protein [Tissierellia bacterium]|nr:FMN-binding protein [Tissierellia bacterium]